MQFRIEGWKAKLISFIGNVTLLKSVLTSILIYSLASDVVPLLVIDRIEQLLANFLWNVKGESRLHWVWLSKICLPLNEGGMGIRKLRLIWSCLHANLLWRVMHGCSLWARYAHSKYFRNGVLSTLSLLFPSLDVNFESLWHASSQFSMDYRKWDVSFLGWQLAWNPIGLAPCNNNLFVHEALSNLQEYAHLLSMTQVELASRITLTSGSVRWFSLLHKTLYGSHRSEGSYCAVEF